MEARELGRHNNEHANDVRVSPTDEGIGVVLGERGVTRGTTTLEQTVDLLRRYTEQQEINVIPTRTAVAVHRTHIAWRMSARRTSFWVHLGSFSFRKKRVKVSPREPEGVDYGTVREICVGW